MTTKNNNMTTRFKDFGTGTDVSHEPLSFMIHDETFECYPALPGKVLLDFVSQSSADSPGGLADVIVHFFGKAMKPERYERFMSLIEDPDRVVSMETLGELTSWLVSEYSERPTQQPESSSSGQ